MPLAAKIFTEGNETGYFYHTSTEISAFVLVRIWSVLNTKCSIFPKTRNLLCRGSQTGVHLP